LEGFWVFQVACTAALVGVVKGNIPGGRYMQPAILGSNKLPKHWEYFLLIFGVLLV
jgi:hypothetical protein